jgi:beta-phosphoglucomutase family hydrolase
MADNEDRLFKITKIIHGKYILIITRKMMGERTPVCAVLFDLDGTLIDSEENYYLADKKILEGYDITFSIKDKERYIGTGNLSMMRDLKERFGISESAESLAERKNGIYLEIAEKNTRIYPEMKRFVEMLAEKGISIAIASGSSPLIIERLTRAVGLDRLFKVMISAEEVAHGKPEPDVFLEAARRLGATPERCVVVEDSRYGVEAAVRASMRCIAIPYLVKKPLAEWFYKADLLFENGMEEFKADSAFAWINALD